MKKNKIAQYYSQLAATQKSKVSYDKDQWDNNPYEDWDDWDNLTSGRPPEEDDDDNWDNWTEWDQHLGPAINIDEED